jgi:hypothetical protein
VEGDEAALVAALCRGDEDEFARLVDRHSPAMVDDIEATVAALRSRGVVFEEYDGPDLRTVDGIADIEGNYPSKGIGERGAWFRDSEGNMLGIGQPLRT